MLFLCLNVSFAYAVKTHTDHEKVSLLKGQPLSLNASNADNILDKSINMSGVQKADTVEYKPGKIVLTAKKTSAPKPDVTLTPQKFEIEKSYSGVKPILPHLAIDQTGH